MINYQKFLESIITWDHRISLMQNGRGGKIATKILKYFSFFGKETIWICLISFFLFIWYDPIYLSHIGMIFAFGILIIVPIKKGVNRERPFNYSEQIIAFEKKPTSGSFPSWHSYNIVSQALIISFLTQSYILVIILIILALIVSYSRVQLGVHYATDVIVGSLLGILGFMVTYIFLGPLTLEIISIIEKNITIQIVYRTVNPLLFENIWYLLICIFLYSGIIIPRLYSYLRDHFFKK